MGAGSKILEGLRDAVEGKLAQVMIKGQTWVRADVGSPEHELMVCRQTIADLILKIDCLASERRETEDALKAEVERLREWIEESTVAMRPFAAIEPFEPGYSYWVVFGTPKRCSFTHDDLLRIRDLRTIL